MSRRYRTSLGPTIEQQDKAMASLRRKANREKRMDTNMSGGDETRGIKGEAATGGWTAGRRTQGEEYTRHLHLAATHALTAWNGRLPANQDATAVESVVRLIAAAPALVALVAELADVLIDDSREFHDAPFWQDDGEGTRMIRDARALLARVGGGA